VPLIPLYCICSTVACYVNFKEDAKVRKLEDNNTKNSANYAIGLVEVSESELMRVLEWK
jgi:hypothetical protein